MMKRFLGLFFIAVTAAFSAFVYNDLPAQLVAHFDVHGKPDGTMTRLEGAFAMPVVAFFMLGLFNMLPRLLPRQENFARFQETYWFIINSVIGLMCALNIMLIGYNLGWPIKMPAVILVGVGALFMIVGHVLPRTRSNWLMGIRTPWTLDSEHVWRETHRIGGRTFMIGGLVTVIAAFLPPQLQPIVGVGALVVAGFIPVVYSYFVWRAENRT